VNVEDVKKLQKKLQDAERRKIKAETVIENIEAGWKKEFGFSTVKEAEEYCKELEEKIQKNRDRLKELELSLESVVDWDSL